VIIESSAPTRVDLAGGTIDIPPLFLFHPGAATVNFAVNLLARCRIETRDDSKIILRSMDRGLEIESSVEKIDELANEPRLELLAKLVHFFRPDTGFELTAESSAPAGAGLAGSSTLNIATIGALNLLVGGRYSEDRFIQIAANIECQVIRVPTGFQDYYSAQFGGASCIHFRPDGIYREPLKIDFSKLNERIAVCYTGEPRNSGTNNWEITKRHIDGDRELFELFEKIRDNALNVREAIISEDWDRLGQLIAEAHPIRRSLSPNITTPQMDKIIETALQNGAIAPKVCGAGGGGCIAFICREGEKNNVEKAIASIEGVEVIDWQPVSEGLKVSMVQAA
jgi:D-glycero-alpha-D-manno-heptose-7-phosphate kinase